jgi:hypothetical protein
MKCMRLSKAKSLEKGKAIQLVFMGSKVNALLPRDYRSGYLGE